MEHPEWTFEIVYLTVCGDLTDAWQSRELPHDGCVKLVLRAGDFFDMWATYLELCGYKKAPHLISPQFKEIIQCLIDSYLSLLIIYRDHIPENYPLLPWLHSSEPTEHVYAEGRKNVKDFTLFQFYQMMPKFTI